MIRDGWLHTGDLGRRDPDGHFFLAGRVKDLIITGGENVSPLEVEDAIQAHKEVNGFLGLYSYNGPAIVDAVTAANARSRYKIITFDAEPKTMQALQAGKIDFTVVQKPYEFGYRSVEFLYKAKTEGVDKARQELKIPANGLVDTGVELISQKNYPDFKKRMDALGVKSS